MSYPPPPSDQPPGYPPQGYPAPGQASGVAYASWIQRVGGYIIDSIPSAILSGIASTDTDRGGLYWVLTLISLAYTIWNRWYMGGTTGQSIGRRALGIRLVGLETGQPIGIGKAFLRDICHILDTLACFIGWLFPLWDAQKQTFADKIMKTIVVK